MRAARWFNNRKPEVIVVAYEHDARAGSMVDAPTRRREQVARQAGGEVLAAGPIRRTRPPAGQAVPPVRSQTQQQQQPQQPARAVRHQQEQQPQVAHAVPQQDQQQGPALAHNTAAAVKQPSSSNGGSSSGMLVQPARRRTRRSTAVAQPPPLQVLPDDARIPTMHENPRANLPADAADSDLSYG